MLVHTQTRSRRNSIEKNSFACERNLLFDEFPHFFRAHAVRFGHVADADCARVAEGQAEGGKRTEPAENKIPEEGNETDATIFGGRRKAEKITKKSINETCCPIKWHWNSHPSVSKAVK
jgi:hypothetical protein